MSAPFSTSFLRTAVSLGVLMLGQGFLQASTTMGNSSTPGTVTVGNYNTGNCYPFMCNDSGTNVGQSIDYQQVYGSTAFPSITPGSAATIDSITWTFASQFGGNAIAIGGTYTFEWGYAALNSVNNLSSTLANNYINNSETLIGTATIPAGGVNDNPTLTLSGFTPFTYDPSLGNLLLEIIVTNQDIVANGSGNGYNEADSNGNVTSRVYCLGSGNTNCIADSNGL